MLIIPDIFVHNMQANGIHDGVYLLLTTNSTLAEQESLEFAQAVNPMTDAQKVLNTMTVKPDKGKIPTDTLREVIAYETKAPVGVPSKTIYIYGIDMLTSEGTDILLKTLEDRHANSLIIMTAGAASGVRQTILSRSIVFRYNAPSGNPDGRVISARNLLFDATFKTNTGIISQVQKTFADVGVETVIRSLYIVQSMEVESKILKTALSMQKVNTSAAAICEYLANAYWTLAHYVSSIESLYAGINL